MVMRGRDMCDLDSGGHVITGREREVHNLGGVEGV